MAKSPHPDPLPGGEGERRKEFMSIVIVLFICKVLYLFFIVLNDEERRDKQDVVINVILYNPLLRPGGTDNLHDAVDYRTITKKIIEMVEKSEYYLVEALAEHVAEICLENPAVARVKVSVEKPTALRYARSVGVEINRERRD